MCNLFHYIVIIVFKILRIQYDTEERDNDDTDDDIDNEHGWYIISPSQTIFIVLYNIVNVVIVDDNDDDDDIFLSRK